MTSVNATNRIRSPRQIIWTESADHHLARMRNAGTSLRAMAAAFGLSRSAVTERSRRLGLVIPSRPIAINRPTPPKSDLTRDPLPAGHELSWGLINQGTCLEGAPYTPPAPPRGRRTAEVKSENSYHEEEQ